jgi:flagellar basal-body rod protein FlgB
MSGPLDSVTGALVGKALDVSLATHQTIANNIANASTPGYRPLKIDFEEVMGRVRSAVESGADDDSIRSLLAGVDATPEQDPEATSVLLDRQMIWLAKNTTHYQALLRAQSQFGSLMSTAIKGGRG